MYNEAYSLAHLAWGMYHREGSGYNEGAQG